MDFNRYFNNDDLEAVLKGWAQTHPNLAALEEIGRSYENRPLWMLALTNRETGRALDKPALWIDANIHATELAGTTTALYVANALLEGYGQDENITRLLDTHAFYILPRVNPDGAALALSDHPRYIRSGVRPYPFEEKAEGLHPEDMDGDGRILQMRVKDPTGDWKVSSLDPRLMEKRRPDEHGGVYYRLISEGKIHDFDGYIIKEGRPLEGLDFNRNFPFEWRTEGEQHGAGPYPASEVEIRSVVDFTSKHPNINVAITFHTFSGVILRPYSTKADTEMDTTDLWVFKKMGEIGKALTGYRCVSTFHDFLYHPKEVTTGAFDDWLYDHTGAYTFTIELWDLPTMAGIADRKFSEWFREHPHEHDLQILKWADENIGADAYVDWYAFDHPQLGQVELGGWNVMYTWRNPPHAFMGNEAARQLPFVLSLANMLPKVEIHTLKATPLGEGAYHLNLVVENTGYLPSFSSEQGKKRSLRPVRAEVELPEGAFLEGGKRRVELGHLEGRSNKFSLTTFWPDGATDNRSRCEWVVRLTPEAAGKRQRVVVKVLSERAGSLQREIWLEG